MNHNLEDKLFRMKTFCEYFFCEHKQIYDEKQCMMAKKSVNTNYCDKVNKLNKEEKNYNKNFK